MYRFFFFIFVFSSCALSFSQDAQAFFQGQFNYSGFNGSCLSCHGSKQYQGIEFRAENVEQKECWVADRDTDNTRALKKRNFYKITANKSFHISLLLKNPGNPNAQGQALCPDTDCCEGSPAPTEASICNQEEFSVDGRQFQNNSGEKTCVDFIHQCKDFASAGLNVLSEKKGAFTIAEDDVSLIYFSESDHSQISHRVARGFSQGDLLWEFDYTPPATKVFDRLWVGANVSNNNSRADAFDLNSNATIDFMIGEQLPNYCALCQDGNEPDASGQCAGCSCSSEKNAPQNFLFFAVSVLGFIFYRKMRNT